MPTVLQKRLIVLRYHAHHQCPFDSFFFPFSCRTHQNGGKRYVLLHPHWYLIEFGWRDGEWRYIGADEQDEEVVVKDRDGCPHTVKRLNPSDAKRTLGIWLAPDGNNKQQLQHLNNVAKQWASRVKSGHLSKKDAWLLLTTTIMKTLEYPLLALTLSDNECKEIEKHLLQAGLPKVGCAKTFPRDVIHAPLCYQGFGLRPLYFTMGTRHLQALMKHSQSDSITGQLLRASIERLKVEMGSGDSLFTQDYRLSASYATDCWVKHTWRYLQEEGITLYEDTPNLKPRRQNDKFIMPSLQALKLRPTALQRVNRCRLYLQVTTLSSWQT